MAWTRLPYLFAFSIPFSFSAVLLARAILKREWSHVEVLFVTSCFLALKLFSLLYSSDLNANSVGTP